MLTVYTKNNCPYCQTAKAHLKTCGVMYEEINIEQDTEAREFLIAEGHRTMPQIYYKGKLFVSGGAQNLAKLDEDMIKSQIKMMDNPIQL